MKCHRAGRWRMEVLNVKESHFQSRILCLCSRTPTQEEIKAFPDMLLFRKLSPYAAFGSPTVGRGSGRELRTRRHIGEGEGWAVLRCGEPASAEGRQGLQGRRPRKKQA